MASSFPSTRQTKTYTMRDHRFIHPIGRHRRPHTQFSALTTNQIYSLSIANLGCQQYRFNEYLVTTLYHTAHIKSDCSTKYETIGQLNANPRSHSSGRIKLWDRQRPVLRPAHRSNSNALASASVKPSPPPRSKTSPSNSPPHRHRLHRRPLRLTDPSHRARGLRPTELSASLPLAPRSYLP